MNGQTNMERPITQEQEDLIAKLDSLPRRETVPAFQVKKFDKKPPYVFEHVAVVQSSLPMLYGLAYEATIEGDEKCILKHYPEIRSTSIAGEKCYKELKLLGHFQHENLLGLLDIIPPKDFKSLDGVSFVVEWMPTDLSQVIRNKRISLQEDPELFIKWIMYQILRGLKHLHSANVAHGNLKPSNILVDDECTVKICDFGLPNGDELSFNMNHQHKAPETLMLWDKVTPSIDVWSLGLILAEIYNGKPLFAGKSHLDQLDVILEALGIPDDLSKLKGIDKAIDYLQKKPKLPKKPMQELVPTASPLALDLLEKIFTLSPDERINVDQAIDHPFFAEITKIEDEPATPFHAEDFEAFKSDNFDTNKLKLMIYKYIMEREQKTMEEIKEAKAEPSENSV